MHWFQFKTKFGYVKVNYREKGILSLDLNSKVRKQDKHYKVYHELKDDLCGYFNGQKTDFNKYRIIFDDLTEFGKKVLKETTSIPYGKTKTYSQIAEAIGKPKACRAVGNALNKNPVPIVIPCHRVIRNNGGLGGFYAGVKLKKMLLFLENSKINIDKRKGNVFIIKQ